MDKLMNPRIVNPLLLVTLLFTAVACCDASPAADVLKQSMAKYQALKSFKTQCDWQEFSQTNNRTIFYVKPNRFKVTSTHGIGFVQTSVCDGVKVVEYTTLAGLPATSAPAPASLSAARSMQIYHPMFCGSLLYQFFGGPGNLAHLVDSAKAPVTFGANTKIDGVNCKIICFYATGLYGKTEVAIGDSDQLVRRITYGSEPLRAMLKGKLSAMMTPDMLRTTETFHQISVNKSIASNVFATTIPKGISTTKMPDLSASSEYKPPVPLGTSAPNFTVVSLTTGAKTTLSQLRGQVVMVDFWATWCPPCRRSLPETQSLAAKYGHKGLAVMAISNEQRGVINPFLNTNHYNFPTFLDAGDSAERAYGISGIPTLAIVDKRGNLSAFLVGLQDPQTVRVALKKAGLAL